MLLAQNERVHADLVEASPEHKYNVYVRTPTRYLDYALSSLTPAKLRSI